VHLARGAARVNGVTLGAGDALRLTDETSLHIDAGRGAEALVFDLP
jgi:redox-sensitive bicupin YhaK (pirin superfamily)